MHARGGVIAIISAPSAYRALHELVSEAAQPKHRWGTSAPPTLCARTQGLSRPDCLCAGWGWGAGGQYPERGDAFIFEYDARFASFGEAFVKYQLSLRRAARRRPAHRPACLAGSHGLDGAGHPIVISSCATA
eukprot:COSAG01_NODE_1731_length_9369_cov_35.048220_10_plen_133_part_00